MNPQLSTTVRMKSILMHFSQYLCVVVIVLSQTGVVKFTTFPAIVVNLFTKVNTFYINKFEMFVCLAMRSAMLRPTELKLGTGVGFGELGGNRQLFVATRQVKGHLEVNLFRNALRPPNSVTMIVEGPVGHCHGQRSCRGHLGSTRGQIA